MSLDIDPESKREELIKGAEEAEREAKAEQAEILNAVKNDEELTHESYEWVQVGDAEFKVSTTLPGKVIDILQAFDGEDMPPMENIIEAAIIQTESIRTDNTVVSDTDSIADFWSAYYEEYGSKTINVVANRILNPAIEETQEGVPKSFRGQQRR